MKKLTTQQFIEKAKQIHGSKYDYSKVEYVNNHTKVCIICSEHKEHGLTMFYYSNLNIDFPYQVYTDKNKLINTITKNGKNINC